MFHVADYLDQRTSGRPLDLSCVPRRASNASKAFSAWKSEKWSPAGAYTGQEQVCGTRIRSIMMKHDGVNSQVLSG